MALRDPIAVYNAATNMEAQFVKNALLASGVEAFVMEDISQVGTRVGGLVPEIHKPQVWVERADIERAKPVLDDFEVRSAELRRGGAEGLPDRPPIEVVCDECSKSTTFPSAQRGSVQDCPHCGAYLDVGDEELPDNWAEGADEEEVEEP